MAKNAHLKDLQALGPLTVLRADLEEEGSLASTRPSPAAITPSSSTLVGVRCLLRPELQGDGHVLDEDSWSDVDYLRAEKPPTWGYCVSKVLVEEAASSVPNCLSLLSGDEVWLGVLKVIESTSGSVPLGHIDDLCRAELFVAEEPPAAGRYSFCGLSTTVAELARFLARKYPQYDVERNLHTVDGRLLEKPRACLSSAKLVREGFEFKHKTLDEIYDDVVEYGKDLGILPN
ncbi:unnamed protein product [Urochloa decumbens]|uniref:Anthocyanidin reductase n=1 Tax=Urochloa decumbens TaxID=240449 RepID=A0ABC9CSD0_9POAL